MIPHRGAAPLTMASRSATADPRAGAQPECSCWNSSFTCVVVSATPRTSGSRHCWYTFLTLEDGWGNSELPWRRGRARTEYSWRWWETSRRLDRWSFPAYLMHSGRRDSENESDAEVFSDETQNKTSQLNWEPRVQFCHQQPLKRAQDSFRNQFIPVFTSSLSFMYSECKLLHSPCVICENASFSLSPGWTSAVGPSFQSVIITPSYIK